MFYMMIYSVNNYIVVCLGDYACHPACLLLFLHSFLIHWRLRHASLRTGWALAAVTSRAFRVKGPSHPAACLPLIDMANHAGTPNAAVRPVGSTGVNWKHSVMNQSPCVVFTLPVKLCVLYCMLGENAHVVAH